MFYQPEVLGAPRSREWSPARLERRPSHYCRLVSGCWIRCWEPPSDSMEREEKTWEFLTAPGRIRELAALTVRATTAALRATLCVPEIRTPCSGSGSCGGPWMKRECSVIAPWSPFWSICWKAQVGNGVTTDPIAQPPRSFPSSLGRAPPADPSSSVSTPLEIRYSPPVTLDVRPTPKKAERIRKNRSRTVPESRGPHEECSER